jgi:hypothetical protein
MTARGFAEEHDKGFSFRSRQELVQSAHLTGLSLHLELLLVLLTLGGQQPIYVPPRCGGGGSPIGICSIGVRGIGLRVAGTVRIFPIRVHSAVAAVCWRLSQRVILGLLFKLSSTIAICWRLFTRCRVVFSTTTVVIAVICWQGTLLTILLWLKLFSTLSWDDSLLGVGIIAPFASLRMRIIDKISLGYKQPAGERNSPSIFSR